jgi:hypothetical protein
MPSNPWGGGGALIAWPVASAQTAAQIEVNKNFLQAANTNPFTAQQQIQDWVVSYTELSVSLPSMNASDGQNWMYFLDNLLGIVNVFQFPSTFCTNVKWNYWITSDGTVSKYFRMKNPNHKVVVKVGAIYSITFECREAR